MSFPFIVKSQEGARAKYAHLFFVCKNEKGLKEMLEFEGFIG